MLQIKLTKNAVAIADPEYAELLSMCSWHLAVVGYAATRVREKIIYMHHLILPDAPAGFMRDHINRNKLDNRRENLRFVTHQENMLNRADKKYKGIGVDSLHGTFKAYYDHITIGQPKRRVNIGTFYDRELAYLARQKYMESLGGK